MSADPFAGLNPEQRAAVEHRDSPLLVLAGAGSGKTRVIARRIQRLLGEGADPASILALTFTNKAAREMRERVTGNGAAAPFLGTFHALGLKLLRRHAPLVGLPHDFAVLDRGDQEALVRDCLKEVAGAEAWSERRALQAISRAKNNLRPVLGPPPLAELAERYAGKLKAARAVDFDDLLVLPLRLLREHPEAAARVRPSHVLVDEFQDTNPAQAELLERLWPESGDVCVVGDEDQSIYGFRGATVGNLVDFPKRHPATRVIRLERNYRSTAPILAAAASLVARNRQRIGKTLKAERGKGDKVRVRRAASAESEAEAVIEEASRLVERFGGGQVAVLYRTNAQSRLIEEALVRRGIPYRLVKGQRFYERREVKDVLAYLRLIANPDDDLSFARIVNVPARGIGPAVLGDVDAAALQGGTSRLAAAAALAADGTGVARRLQPFVALIRRLAARVESLAPGELVRAVVKESGYDRHLEREGEGEAGERRGENIEELARKAEADAPAAGLDALRSFLDQVTIASEPEEAGAGALSLMTLHNAKGLEFDGVVIAGVEEGLLPHQPPSGEEDEADVEEERRLLYVGMTRAKETLVLTCAQSRPLWGEARFSRPSRFLDELARDALDIQGDPTTAPAPARTFSAPGARPAVPRAAAALPVRSAAPAEPSDGFPVGGWVRHPTYGDGMVIDREGGGDGLKLGVRFSSGIRKKFQARYAGLKPLKRSR